MSQQQAAQAMGWSLSKLVRLENGSGKTRPSDVLALFTFYGAPPAETAELADLARSLLADPLPSREAYAHLLNQAYLNFLDFERAAAVERHWHCNLIPGPLQTAEYAYEVLSKASRRSEAEVEQLLEARIERQRILEPENGPRLSFLIDESVLLRPVGSPATMRAQADRILNLVEEGHIGFGVVPLELGMHPGVLGSFILLEFDDPYDDGVLYMESPRGDFFSRDDLEIISSYQVVFTELEQSAITGTGLEQRLSSIH